VIGVHWYGSNEGIIFGMGGRTIAELKGRGCLSRELDQGDPESLDSFDTETLRPTVSQGGVAYASMRGELRIGEDPIHEPLATVRKVFSPLC